MRALRIAGGLEPAFGGPSASSVASSRAAALAGMSTTFVSPVPRERETDVGPALELMRRDGVSIAIFPTPLLLHQLCRDYGISPALARWVFRRARSFDVLHAHGAWTFTTLATLVIAKCARRPAALTPHEALTNFDIAKSGLPARAVKRLLRRLYLFGFDLVVTASQLEAADSRPGATRARVAVIPHPVERAELAPREGLGTGLRVGYLGRIDPKKNLHLLVEALAGLPKEVSLEIGGDGDAALRARIQQQAEDRGVADRVRWHGFLDAEEKRRFLGEIDVLALPSAYECFGMAAAEAMAAGVPVLVSKETGVAGLVSRYDCGYVVAASAPDILAALLDAAGDRVELGRRGQRALVAARAELSLERHGRLLREEYLRLTRHDGAAERLVPADEAEAASA